MSLLTHMERWKDIEGFEGLYQVSTCGRVKSLGNDKSKKERILKQYKHRNGYLQVCLYKYGKFKRLYVHRLVAIAFIPNPKNLPEVNHITEDKQLNYVWCLEWVDRISNQNFGTRNKRISKSLIGVNINHPSLSKRVLCIETNTVYSSIMEAQRFTGINNGSISSCCRGKLKTAGKLHWQYIN